MVPWNPNEDDRRVSKILWSIVSKAADKSRRDRHDIFCDGIYKMVVNVQKSSFSEMIFIICRLLRVKKIIRNEVICETRFNSTFNYFRYKRKVGVFESTK